MLAEVLDPDGVVEHRESRSDVEFMALHDGLEANNWEIAREAAERTGASLDGLVDAVDRVGR